jgi:DNA-binding NtrC family response regulator
VSEKLRILVVDNDLAFRKFTARILDDARWEVDGAATGEMALEKFEHASYSAVLSDLVMGGMTGLELLKKLREIDPHVPIVMVTGHGSIDSAVEAMKAGANDYVTKPLIADELRLRLVRVIEHEQERRRLGVLQEELEQVAQLDKMIGPSQAMKDIFSLVRKVAPTDTNVLIRGETGTGKGLLARAIHLSSPRSEGPFVSVNCAALTPTLLESELFGHEKGSFTGATERHMGRFELANHGTLFLDEIAELNAELQTKLLDAVQERKFERVGGSQTVHVDVRLITATNRNLNEAVRAGKFREDLYYRLNVVPITIPPLRSRPEDIEALSLHFLNEAKNRTGRKTKSISPAGMRQLLEYHWPGNVRELQNTIERAVILADGNELNSFEFESAPTDADPVLSTDRPLKAVLTDETARIEKAYLHALLTRHRGNVSKTAEIAGIDRRTVFEKMKQYGLKKEDYK